MPAETLNCPMCGAPASADSSRCEHCGARLATVACPRCFGLVFEGAKFCSHCGSPVNRIELAETKPLPCPRCRTKMASVLVGPSKVQECPKCEGLWVDNATFEEICTNTEKQAAVLAIAVTVPRESIDIEKVCYLPCPSCRKLMNRVNFSRCSNVVVDICKPHGTWFDRDELRKVVEFIRAGGIEKARALDVEDLEARRRAATAPQSPLLPPAPMSESDSSDRHAGISLIGALIDSILG